MMFKVPQKRPKILPLERAIIKFQTRSFRTLDTYNELTQAYVEIIWWYLSTFLVLDRTLSTCTTVYFITLCSKTRYFKWKGTLSTIR